jgi:hypothetical protein
LLDNQQPDHVGTGTEHREAAIEAEDHGAFSFSSQTFDIEQVPPGRLRPDPGNPRRIDKIELATLTESLRHFGLVQPILARREDSTIIGGHQRLVAAQRLGLAKTRLGDLWQLGDHRLLCGDATSRDDVARLLDGRRAQLGFADARRTAEHPGDRELTAARQCPAETRALDPTPTEGSVRQLANNLLDAVDGALYVLISPGGLPHVSQILAEEGGHWSDTLVWLTGASGGEPGSYQRAYQPIWFGRRDGSVHTWCGPFHQSDVWKVSRPDETPRDPAKVPPALLERAMEHASRPGDLVLDLLGGAGSSIIAAERTGRVARALEIDPWSCDLAIARWSALTGGVPSRASTDGDGSATPGGVR